MEENRIPTGDIGEKIQIPVCRKTVSVECNTDYNLADYQMPIKRLLHLTTNVMPPMQYVSGNSADISGDVEFTALYVGEDNQLYTLSIKDDYTTTVGLDKAYDLSPDSVVDVYAKFEPASAVSRVISPKKLNIKTVLNGDVQAYGNAMHKEKIVGDVNSERVERLVVTKRCSEILHGRSETITVNDKITLDDRKSADDQPINIRVIGAYAYSYITDIDASDGVAACRGDLYIKVYTCCDEDGNIKVLKNKVSFTCNVDIENLSDDFECCAYGKCGAVSVSISDNDIGVSVPVNVNITAAKNKSIKAVSDAYSTESPCEISYRDYDIVTNVVPFGGNFTLSGSIPLSDLSKGNVDGITADDKIIDSFVTLSPEEITNDKGKYIINGKSIWIVLFENAEGEYKISLLEMPFRYEFEGKNGLPDSSDIAFESINTRARIEDDRLLLDSEIALSGTLFMDDKINMLDEMNFSGEYEGDGAGYTVYFPCSTDTLWGIGKKYHKSLTNIMASNNLLGNVNADDKKSIDGINYLIV